MTAEHSAIYSGRVRHRRLSVREREFSYPVAMAYIDLDEVAQLNGGRLLRRWPGINRFRRRDYFGRREVPLAQAVRDLVEERTGRAPDGPIRLLTNLRAFGHCFNPVSFYYCFDREERLDAVVADVTNTPWGQRQAYVVETGDSVVATGTSDKLMHVSPFMGMEQTYDWRASTPGQTVSVHIDSHENGTKVFDATLALLERRPFTRSALARLNLRFPAAELRNVALIYGHALALRLRGVPWHTNPASRRAS